jgi:ribose 5-phosphate isomerase B
VRVYLGSDHAGFELKAAIVTWLGEAGHEAVDCGPVSYDPQDDYPVYVLQAAQRVIRDPGSLGIVIGGSGNGEQIAANKVPGVRAALAWTVETAQLARADVQPRGRVVVREGLRRDTVLRRGEARQAPRHDRRLRENRRTAYLIVRGRPLAGCLRCGSARARSARFVPEVPRPGPRTAHTVTAHHLRRSPGCG